jgi:ABC-2 type transport system ATP-binding protein
MENNTIIKVSNVSKKFKIPQERRNSIKKLFMTPFRRNRVQVFQSLQNISFEVKRGEFVGIVGRNGSGKSTLLKLVAGIYAPDKGTIEIGGRLTPFLELGVGFNPELTGKENVYLNGIILGMSRSYITQKYNEIVKFAELDQFMEMPVKNYSSGMLVRLAFSIAIQADADIFLLDEILAVGDEGFQRKSVSVINQFKRSGKTILFVSHDMSTVQRFCDRAILINDSHLVMDGKPVDIIEKYRELNLAREQKQAAEQPGANERRKRVGNKSVELVKADILNDQGQETNLFTEKGDITLRMHYKVNAHNIYDKAYIGVSIYREDGLQVTGTNGKIHKLPIDVKAHPQGIVEYKIDNKFFTDGTYSFTVGVFDFVGDAMLDFHSEMYPFQIRLYNDDQGVYSLPSSWSFKAE